MSLASVEERPLEVDQNSIEFRLLKAYAQHRLSASPSGHQSERGAKSVRGGGADTPVSEEGGIALQGRTAPAPNKDQKRKKKRKKRRERASWKCLFIPSCLRPQAPPPSPPLKDAVNGGPWKPHPGVGSLPEREVDSEISLLAERFAEIVDHSRSSSERARCRVIERTLSLEDDGAQSSKAMPEADEAAIGKEDKVIDAIVAILQKSGDELEEKMRKDKTFCNSVLDMMSYAFFRRVTDQFLEGTPIDPTVKSQEQVKSLKVALIMEVTAQLAAVDNHPMNRMLGFGTKFLQENFSPWIQNQGGWDRLHLIAPYVILEMFPPGRRAAEEWLVEAPQPFAFPKWRKALQFTEGGLGHLGPRREKCWNFQVAKNWNEGRRRSSRVLVNLAQRVGTWEEASEAQSLSALAQYFPACE